MIRTLALVALLLAAEAHAGWVRVSWTVNATAIRSGCVAAGQYERAPVAVSGSSGTVTIEGLPDSGRCYFSLNAGAPQDEWYYDFTAQNFARSAPGSVRNLNVVVSPTLPGSQHIRLVVIKRRAGANSIQLADVQLMQGTTAVAWPTSARATNPGGNNPSNEGPALVLDVSSATKWLDFNFTASATAVTGSSALLIDAGAPLVFNGFRVRTANDSPERDPVSFRLETAPAASGPWTVRATVNDATIPTARQTWSATFGVQ